MWSVFASKCVCVFVCESDAFTRFIVVLVKKAPSGFLLLQTCAHRYQKRHLANKPQESRDITGRCYVLSQQLTIDESIGDEGGDWSFCEGRIRGHERYGSCQQGLSVTFTKDYHYIVFGAPGAFNWKGEERGIRVQKQEGRRGERVEIRKTEEREEGE